MSDSKMNLMQKIAKARVLLQKKNLKKSGLNKFAGFKYFELADFLPSVNEIFDELGLYAEFSIIPTDTEKYDGINEIITVPPVASLTIYDADDPTISPRRFTSDIAEAGTKGASPIQQLGSIHTYMRRYLYMEALEIVESDALDAVVGTEKVNPSSTSKKDAPKQNASADMAVELTKLKGELKNVGVDVHAEDVDFYIRDKAKVESIDGGKLLSDAEAMKRVIAVMRDILKKKSA